MSIFLVPQVHKDKRRVLTEYVSDFPFRRAKVIEVKEDSILGNHYHKKTDSAFYLFKGKAWYDLENEKGRLKVGETLIVGKMIPHTFKIKKGSIMFELASKPYDKEDEIPIVK